MVDRTAASFIPQNCSNQRKRVCPAVCANGRFKAGSRGPGACPISITSLTTAPQDRENQTQHDADDDAGDDWKIKNGMFALDPNVARQAPQPCRSKAAPQDRTEQNDHRTGDDEEFSELAHYREGCAN